MSAPSITPAQADVLWELATIRAGREGCHPGIVVERAIAEVKNPARPTATRATRPAPRPAPVMRAAGPPPAPPESPILQRLRRVTGRKI